MNTKTPLLLLAALMVVVAEPRPTVAASDSNLPVAIPPAEEILSRLKKEHPRLLATAQDFAQLKERVKSDARLRQWHGQLREEGVRILKARPSKYEIPDGLRLLATSRRVLGRVQTLAMLYRLDGDQRYADRAWKELETAANFKDWNPRHFLDTAEMTHAFAIGYDWLYDAWTDAQRATLRTAMVEKGIKLALDIQSKHTWWAKAHHNWNQVCNGGVGMGALALADVEPKLAGDFLNAAMQSIQLAMVEYGPDGAWAEGPGYWNYATTYNVTFLAALQTALGTDFGLAKIPGFSEAGSFPIYASGPTGLSFSYADCHAGRMGSPVLFWLAREFNRPDFAWFQSQRPNDHALSLLWYDPRLVQKPAVPPLDKYFRNSEVTLMRSAWDDGDALFVGFKSGDNKANHSHLDLGSFVLDALGTRWAEDLGADNYNFPGYFGSKRWNYYRLRAEGHNTLVINPGLDPDQDPRAASKIIKFDSQPDRAVAIADLTAAYAKNTTKARRGIAMLNRCQVLVQDEVQTKAPSEVWWFLHTRAKAQVSADGRTATLSEGKARLVAQILSPSQARFTVMKAEPLPAAPHPEKQGGNREGRKLAIELEGVQDLRLAVLLTPLQENVNAPAHRPELSPLAAW
jgi:hypothetical protein